MRVEFIPHGAQSGPIREMYFKIFAAGSSSVVGGIFGSTLGVVFFKFLRESGNIDLIISLMYIIFLAVIGTLMLIESSLSIIKKSKVKLRSKRKRNISHFLPLKYKFYELLFKIILIQIQKS